jgi:hypothetical protein
MEERPSASACLAHETCLPDETIANERKGPVGRMGLAFPTVHDVSVPERWAYVTHCMHWALSGSSREEGVDVKQTSYETCKEWR